MKVEVSVGALKEALRVVSTTVDPKTLIAECSNVLIRGVKQDDQGWLVLYSTTTRADTLTKIPATVEEDGCVLVRPDSILKGLFNAAPDNVVKIQAEEGKDNKAKFRVGTSRFALVMNASKTLEQRLAKQYPLKTKPTLSIPAKFLKELYARTNFCVFVGEGHRYGGIRGVRIAIAEKKFRVWATDSVIATETYFTPKGDKDLQPASFILGLEDYKRLNTVLSGLDTDVDVTLEDRWIYIHAGDTLFGCMTLADSYPNLTPMFDNVNREAVIQINRQAFLDSLTKARSFSETGNIVMSIEKGILGLQTASSVMGDFEDALPIAYDQGETDKRYWFRASIDYLLKPVHVMETDAVTLRIGQPNEAAVLSEVGGDDRRDVDAKYIFMGRAA